MRADESAGDYLTRYINARAGERPAAQWFRRTPQRHGVGLKGINLAAALEARTLDAAAFPRLFLSDTGQDAAHRQLIADFHAWQAPWLLVLPDLAPAERRAFEQAARAQPFVVETQYRLYPEIVDDGAIQAALVEAMLRRSQPQPAQSKEDSVSTFYIELSPDPTE